jgi:hypothetical protein
MKPTPISLLAVACILAWAVQAYDFRAPSKRDLQLAQLGADWMFHDDWHTAPPANAYAGRWFSRIPETRAKLVAKHKAIPVDVKTGTNSIGLLTYTVQSRLLTPRSSEPDPWPSPRIIIEESQTTEGHFRLRLRWSNGVRYDLKCREGTNGPIIVAIEDMVFID